MVQQAAAHLLHWDNPLSMGLHGFNLVFYGGQQPGLRGAKQWLAEYLNTHNEPDVIIFCLGRLEVSQLDIQPLWKMVKSILRYFRNRCYCTIPIWSDILPLSPFEPPNVTQIRRYINHKAAALCHQVLQHNELEISAPAWDGCLVMSQEAIDIFLLNIYYILCNLHWWWVGASAFRH